MLSKWLRVVPLAVGVVVGVGACQRKQPQPEQEEAPSAASADPMADAQEFLTNEDAKLTLEVYRALLLDLSSCDLTQRGINPKCPAYQHLRKARSRRSARKDLRTMNSALGKELISHEHPAVRLQAAKLLQSVASTEEDEQKVVLEAAKTEKEPAVLATMIRVLGRNIKSNPEIAKLLIKLADHESDAVRRETMNWFLTPAGSEVTGTFEKVLERVENDPSMNVRGYLCSRLYGSSDPRAIPVFEKILTAEATEQKLYNACWTGLVKSWTGSPKPNEPSQEGFELTLKILEAKPRTQERPGWSGIATLKTAKTEYRDSDTHNNKWVEQVKGWYKKDRMVRLLKEIVDDKNANWMARTASLRTLHELGEPKATFTLLKAKYASAEKGNDFHVKRQIDDILRKMDAAASRAAGGAKPRSSSRRPPRRPPPPPQPEP